MQSWLTVRHDPQKLEVRRMVEGVETLRWLSLDGVGDVRSTASATPADGTCGVDFSNFLRSPVQAGC